ncbi:NUC130/3NT domain protein, partial [Ostertagia ostertagi]
MAAVATAQKNSRYSMSERNLGLMMEIIRKDPESYKEEFMEQFDHYLHTMKLLHLQPQQHRMELQPLLESVTFLSGLAKHYPEQAKEFSAHLISVLREQGSGLDPHVRMSFCKALVLLRNQNLIDPLEFMEIFFELVRIEDKQLRKFIMSSISSLLKRLYNQKKNMKLLGKIQNFCFAKMKVMSAFRHAKKTRKRAKDFERSKKAINKKKKAKKEGRSKECNLLAIQSLYDPQEFADKLYRMLESKKIDKYELRLFRIALCARTIGVHRLHTLSFYSYLHRYLQPKQRDYKTYKNKNVSMAARALITLFRSVNPRLLARKDRGRPTDGDDEKEFLGFAKPAVADSVPGAEVLEEEREETGVMEVDDDDDSDESIEISDVDTDEVDSDEEPSAKKRALDKTESNDEEDEEESEDGWETDDGEEGDEEDGDEVCDGDTDVSHQEIESSSQLSGGGEVDPKKKAEIISSNRILTQEEFKQIRIYQLKKKLIGEKRLKRQLGNARKNDDVKL